MEWCLICTFFFHFWLIYLNFLIIATPHIIYSHAHNRTHHLQIVATLAFIRLNWSSWRCMHQWLDPDTHRFTLNTKYNKIQPTWWKWWIFANYYRLSYKIANNVCPFRGKLGKSLFCWTPCRCRLEISSDSVARLKCIILVKVIITTITGKSL